MVADGPTTSQQLKIVRDPLKHEEKKLTDCLSFWSKYLSEIRAQKLPSEYYNFKFFFNLKNTKKKI